MSTVLPGTSVSPPVSQPGPGSGGSGASPTPGSVPAPPAGAPTYDWSTAPAEFRTAYETLKREHDGLRDKYSPWEKLNARPEDVGRSHQSYAQMSREAETLGQQLGYDAQEVRQLFGQDPVSILAFLRQTAQTRQAQPQGQPDILKEIQKRMQPYEQRMEAQFNREAEARFDREFERLFKTDFKDGLPDDCRSAIYDLASDLMGADDDGIRRLKLDGQTADVQKHFAAAKERFLKVVTSFNKWEQERRSGPSSPQPPKPPQPPGKAVDRILSTGQRVGDLLGLKR